MMSYRRDTDRSSGFGRRATAILFATGVFLIDMLVHDQIDVSVLYAVALLIASRGAMEREIAAFGGLTASLAVIAFAVTFRQSADWAGVWRLLGALAGIGITNSLLVRNARHRRALIEARRARDHSDWLYRSMFLQHLKQTITVSDMNDAVRSDFGMTPGVDPRPANLACIDDGQLLATAQAELARTSRVAAVGAVSASIAHELNQPLGAVVMNGQTCLRYLRQEPPDIASAVCAAERVVHEGNRASDIVRQTRELIAKRRTRDEWTNLHVLIKEAVALVDREIQASGAEVMLELPAQPVWLFGDRVALQQAVINLLGNALTAVSGEPREDRRLTIALACEDELILISVSDTGCGISPENLHRIFDPFFTTKEGGMGMGLAISRSAIEAHGGTLTARNRETGGAIFECKIPLRTDEGGCSGGAECFLCKPVDDTTLIACIHASLARGSGSSVADKYRV